MIKFLLFLLAGFALGYISGPYITPVKPNIVEKKVLHTTPKMSHNADKMSFESAVKRTE